MAKITEKEYQESLDYLENISKSSESNELTEESKEQKMNKLKEGISKSVKEAKRMQEELDSIKKGSDEDDDEDDEEEEGDEEPGDNEENEMNKSGCKSSMKKSITAELITAELISTGVNKDDLEALEKSITSSILEGVGNKFNDLIKSKDSTISDLSKRLEAIENTPLKKSIVAGGVGYIEKSISGEILDNKSTNTVLSKSRDKGKIADLLFNRYNEEVDDLKKSQCSDEVIMFEANSSLSQSTIDYLAIKNKVNLVP